MSGPHDGRAAAPSRRAADGWGPYLALVVLLAPVVVPAAPAQLAILDAFNVIALAAFAVAYLTRRITLRAPFAAGALVITLGSLIATVNAESPSAAAFTLAQDAYLYVWFVMLVSVLRTRGDLVALRMGWVAVGCAVALWGFFVLVVFHGNTTIAGIVGPKGTRLLSTFKDPNMCADYLGMSFFVLLSLGRHVGRGLRWGAAAIMVAAIVATKSNGGALSLAVGLCVWGLVRARTMRLPMPAIAGAALFAISLVAGGAWMISSLGVGAGELHKLQAHSFLARAAHSSQGRFKIWNQLEASMQKAPLGIGPGNSRWMSVTVAGRERAHSFYSKEAHSDYLAYAIERGPLAILVLLALVVQCFVLVRRVWRRRERGGRADPMAGALVAGLAGALACSAVHSLTIERLHFRHFWLLLAMVCAFADSARSRRESVAVAATPARAENAEPLAVASA
jgi:O-antigen ligase